MSPDVQPGRPGPRVVAHRGASAHVAEHTLAAYARALEDGADGVECDVRLTADGHLVCVHDRTVLRTSDGRGAVSTLELADLAQLDFGSWREAWAFDAEAEEPDRDAIGILTLDRLLGLVSDVGRAVEVAVETKHPTRYAGAVERELAEVLRRHGLASEPAAGRTTARVMSFSWLSLRRVRRIVPGLPTVLLMTRGPWRLRAGRLPEGVSVAGPSVDAVRLYPDLVARAHADGHEVHVWTVNESGDLDLCRDLGVDVVITDRPAATLRRLQGA